MTVLDVAVMVEVDGVSLTLRVRPSAAAYQRLCGAPPLEEPASALPLSDAEAILLGSLSQCNGTLRQALERIRADLLEASLAHLRGEAPKRTTRRHR